MTTLRQALRLHPKRLIVSAGLAALVAIAALRCWPIPPALLEETGVPSTVVLDRHGALLYEALSGGGTRSERIDSADLPAELVAATVAAEDRRFWSHAGVDPVALLRAVRHNLLERRVVEGGSTITQQVAKLLIQRREGVHPRGVRAKLREMSLALRLEHRFDKSEILALYLNVASYGNQTVGAARASRAYFGVPPAMLTPAQSAFLAALPQRPTSFNPWRNPASAKARQHAVLRRMASMNMLSAEQLRNALAERLAFEHRQAPFAAPHFVEMVLAAAGERRPARLDTTLDLELQREVEGIVDSSREMLARHGASNVSIVVLDNLRGEWLAWEGSGDYLNAEHGGAINGPLVGRQPGSALKPLTYALAFEEGRDPATVLPDLPSHFPTAEPGVLYSPRNYDGRYRGPLLVRKALAGSENVPAVALAAELGVPKLIRFLTRAGLTTFDRNASYYGLGVTLGNAEVRLDELVAAYAAFARGGVWRAPSALKRSGDSVAERVLVAPRTAFWITDVLSDPEARAFVFGRGGNLEFPFPVAVKTGTSQAYHDNWTVGYTREVTVGVWVGNFDRTALRDSTGVTGAGPIFHAVMLAAERRVAGAAASPADAAIVPRPDNVREETICALSGMRANAWCPVKTREWIRAEQEDVPCAWHHQSDEGLITVWPAEYRQWAQQHGLPAARHEPDAADGRAIAVSVRQSSPARRPTAGVPLAIANPPEGAIYSIDPTLRAEFQALPLRAVASSPTTIRWTVDGRAVGTAPSERQISWPLAVGKHRIEARDSDGRTAEAAVIVK